MFEKVLLHPNTLKDLTNLTRRVPHAILLEGPEHVGKKIIAKNLAAILLGANPEHIQNHGAYRELYIEKSSIPVEQVRDLASFLSLKTTGNSSVRRVVVIPDADFMLKPAQNALLKILEEPPADTVIILTTSHSYKLLPTITSRTQRILIHSPTPEQVFDFFSKKSETETLKRAISMNEGRVGLVADALDSAVLLDIADLGEVKSALSLSLFDQLLLVDKLQKDKEIAIKFVNNLAKIASVSLLQSTHSHKAALQWHRISNASHVATEALRHGVSAKLVLTELILSLR